MRAEIYKDLFLDALWEVVYFPAWWYSRGLRKSGLFCLRQIKSGFHTFGLGILFANFFKPMYAERDLVAYVLSFFVRMFQLFWRSIVMVLWLVFWLAIFVLWIFLPPLAIWKLITG